MTDTLFLILIQADTFLLRTVTNLGYGYKRDPIRIRNNHFRDNLNLDLDIMIIYVYG